MCRQLRSGLYPFSSRALVAMCDMVCRRSVGVCMIPHDRMKYDISFPKVLPMKISYAWCGIDVPKKKTNNEPNPSIYLPTHTYKDIQPPVPLSFPPLHPTGSHIHSINSFSLISVILSADASASASASASLTLGEKSACTSYSG
jgi:hypothetical protein